MYDALGTLISVALFSFLLIKYDAFDRLYEFTRYYERWELDEIILIVFVALLGIFFLVFRHGALRSKESNVCVDYLNADTAVEENNNLSSKITIFYVSALSLIAFLLVLAFFIMDNAIETQKYDASLINIGGRQRMFSQRTALLVGQLAASNEKESVRKGLIETIDNLERSHMALTRGDEGMGIPDFRSETIHDLYFEKRIPYKNRKVNLDYYLLHYLEEVREVLELPDSELSVQNAAVMHVAHDYHSTILPYLHEVVNQYEFENHEKHSDMRKIEAVLLFSALCILLMEALFIFRPMVRIVREKNEELINANRELEKKRSEEKFAALGQMASGMAHEVNNALQPVMGMSDLLLRRSDKSDDIYESLKSINAGTAHIKGIVEGVLEFSRSDELSLDTHNAAEIIGQSIEFAKSLQVKTVNFDVADENLFENLNVNIMCNKTNLVQIFVNLFKNSAEATGGKGTIRCDFERTHILRAEAEMLSLQPGEYAVVRVSDEGCGINEEDLKNLFTPFFTTKEKGTGLGLSTIYGIMKRHGGVIRHENLEESGSMFVLYFPVLKT